MVVNYNGVCSKWGIAFGNTIKEKTVNPLNYIKFNYTNQPLEIFSKLHQKYETAYLLESIVGPLKLAQYSFVGCNPKITIETTNGLTTITDNKTKQTTKQERSLPNHPRKPKTLHQPHGGFPFCRRRLGYISYNAIKYIEKYLTKTLIKQVS